MQRTRFPFEIVIGDDDSTDGTRDILEGYQTQYADRIRLVLHRHRVGWRQNSVATFAECRGEYIALLEGDDYWIDPDKLQLQVDAFAASPNAFLCGARAYIERDGELGQREVAPAVSSAQLSTYGARELFDGTWWFRTCTKVYRRRVLAAAPPHLLGADWAGTLWCIAHENFGPVAFVDRIVGVYREHPDGVWSSLTRCERLASDVRALDDVIPYFFGLDRAALCRLMTSQVAEILASRDASRRTRMACCLRALRRNPCLQSLRALVRGALGHANATTA